ncbi:iron ABC transporter [Pectobacterium actinidiae]|uniref:FecCD family ABC transporter permease n=1 Tax=Pectobacterium actinidiae TaxID=1507808 RepID=A0A1V2R3L1_9GAMM|nr:iron ABC transporter permease [Pectobacterium actinidiae]GKW14661.1 iron ABC transporter [Pectobacterium carotovorum subsp. carotovorum]KHN92384.1 hemin transport system permease protein [Pectobacterium actinidiae]ONK04090.1 iron ABC transporter [Pectobacterium actinidiae]ONK06074.1 iron ABC transporter [Pectobacterium actinidiae]WEF10493.1 iron ABC transporter permease [Pectobacterium actinidiae]
MTSRFHPRTWLIALLLLMAVLMVGAANMGALALSLKTLWQTPFDDPLWHIWLNIRVPRVLLAILVGGALACSGAIMQGLFRNPLADPSLLGISSGAALCVALTIVLPLGLPPLLALYSPMFAAFAGSLAITAIIFILSRSEQGGLTRLLLAGIALNALCLALIGVLTYISTDQQLRQFSLWGMGSLGQAQWPMLLVTSTLAIPGMLATLYYARRLNVLQLGDEEAHYLGINVKRTKYALLLLSSLLVGVAVAVSGVIGFIGLIIPHLMRLHVGADHRWLIPGSILGGACLLLFADTLARTLLAPAEMPVGLLSSLIGGPYFLWLIVQHKGRSND